MRFVCEEPDWAGRFFLEWMVAQPEWTGKARNRGVRNLDVFQWAALNQNTALPDLLALKSPPESVDAGWLAWEEVRRAELANPFNIEGKEQFVTPLSPKMARLAEQSALMDTVQATKSRAQTVSRKKRATASEGKSQEADSAPRTRAPRRL